MINSTDYALCQAIRYAKQYSPFYKKKWDHWKLENFSPQTIRQTLPQLPYTSKEELSKHNSDFLCVSLTDIVECVTTSGTTGDPITIYLTKKDIQRLSFNEKTALGYTGITAEDVVQLTTTMDRQFMAGLAYLLGIHEIGATMIRIGPGVPALQWKSIVANRVTVLIAVPSFIITLINFAKENNINYQQSSVKKIICIGEAIRESNGLFNTLGMRIHNSWNVELYATYASTEMGSAFTECTAQQGGHLIPELLYLEVIKENGQAARNNELGEIVVTTLGVEGTPLVRYQTGDIACLYTDTCACGNTSPRIGPIEGRKNQMIKYKGTTLYPKSLFNILDRHEEIKLYQIVVTKDNFGLDNLTILLEKTSSITAILSKIETNFRALLKVLPKIELVEHDKLLERVYNKNERKPRKIIFQS